MTAATKVADFLRHLANHDLSDSELFTLKAEAFEAVADEEHDPEIAWAIRDVAERARQKVTELECVWCGFPGLRPEHAEWCNGVRALHDSVVFNPCANS